MSASFPQIFRSCIVAIGTSRPLRSRARAQDNYLRFTIHMPFWQKSWPNRNREIERVAESEGRED